MKEFAKILGDAFFRVSIEYQKLKYKFNIWLSLISISILISNCLSIIWAEYYMWFDLIPFIALFFVLYKLSKTK